MGERCTLINYVAHTIPKYTISSFKVPISVCDKLDALTRKFWWKLKEKDGKFLAWRAWDKLCASKATGGLGFKRAKYNNNALLSKLAWLVTSKQDNHSWVHHGFQHSNPSPKMRHQLPPILWFLSSLTILNMLGDPIWFLSFSIMNQLRLSYPSLFLLGPSQTSFDLDTKLQRCFHYQVCLSS